MLDYWTPYVFCYSDTIIGFLVVAAILLFYQKIWWIISGITWMSGELYLTFLLLYGFNEELFLHYTFAQISPQNRPLCTFTVEPLGERDVAMPSLEAQLTFSIAAFLVVHMFLLKRLTKLRAVLVIITFPIFTILALFISRNATLGQLAAGSIFGAANGVRRILLYHFYVKRPIALLGHYSLFGWLISKTPLTVTDYEDIYDQTRRMTKDYLTYVKVLPDEVGSETTLFYEFSDALMPTRREVLRKRTRPKVNATVEELFDIS